MEIVIKIPKEFESHFYNDRFKDSTCQTYDCALGIINSPNPLVDYCSKAEKIHKCLNCDAILKDKTTNYCSDCCNRVTEILMEQIGAWDVRKEK